MNQTQEDQTIDLPDAFLADLVRELDHGDIVGITLGGSYARGEATPYSDVDLACFWREGLRPQQVEEAAGSASAWTQYHRIATGLEGGPEGVKPLRARGIAALYLYRETLAITRSVMRQEHLTVAEEVLRVVRDARERLSFAGEEYTWLKRWM